MSHESIIRAWKDQSFRNGLSAEDLALMPENPAGLIELDDVQLQAAAGAMRPRDLTVNNTCTVDTYVCCCNSVVSCAGCL
jgi:mersacidin/lichenicidin family type 2 lantibiotic